MGSLINIRKGDEVHGDNVRGDKVGGDKTGGNKIVVEKSKNVNISEHSEGTDLQALAAELSKLREVLAGYDWDKTDKEIAIGSVALAEKEALKGNESKVLEHLANAGKWVLDAAKGVAIPLAVEALKRVYF